MREKFGGRRVLPWIRRDVQMELIDNQIKCDTNHSTHEIYVKLIIADTLKD